MQLVHCLRFTGTCPRPFLCYIRLFVDGAVHSGRVAVWAWSRSRSSLQVQLRVFLIYLCISPNLVHYRAVLSRLHGDDVTLLASMAKLKAGRLARVVTDSCLQVRRFLAGIGSGTICCFQFWGGNGFTWDNPVCRMHRDLRLHSVGAGADEVMLSIICKYMGIAPPKPRFWLLQRLHPRSLK